MSGPSTRAARATYHPQSGARISEGLARARRPFRTANAVTGALIMGFATSVYLYSIRAVAQDDFSDLEAPEKREGVRSLEDEKKEKEQRKQELVRDWEMSSVSSTSAPILETAEKVNADRHGVVDGLVGKSVVGLLADRGAFAGKGNDSLLVPGAPDIDRIGSIFDKRVNDGSRVV